ncbi:MAG: hypothetical protein IPJ08_20080 [Burkholderiales bacterium]|nr:hypothetical protein [Burkholderiales bacterium]
MSAFHDSVVATLIVLLIAAALLYVALGPQQRPRIRTLFVVWMATAAISIALVRSSYLSEFTESSIQGHQVTLRFANQAGRTTIIPAKDVRDVLFGLPDKGSRTCYIRLELKDGTSFRSVAKKMPSESCKALRSEYLSQLAQ